MSKEDPLKFVPDISEVNGAVTSLTWSWNKVFGTRQWICWTL